MKTIYSTIALAKSAMERIPLHSWEMKFSMQYISRDHKQPIKRSEFNKVLYNVQWSGVEIGLTRKFE